MAKWHCVLKYVLFQDADVFILGFFFFLDVLLYQTSFVVIEVFEDKVFIVRILRIASSFVSSFACGSLPRFQCAVKFLHLNEILHCLLFIIF